MEPGHRASVLAVSCLSTPVNPRTRAPVALYEREGRGQRGAGGDEARDNKDDFESESDTESDQDVSELENQDFEGRIQLYKMNQSNKEYYAQLERLKKAHLETMAQLESMYQRKLHLKGVAPQRQQDTSDGAYRSAWEQSPNEKAHFHRCCAEMDLSSTASESSEASEDELRDDHIASQLMSPAEKKILKMWNGFSLQDYIESAQRSPRFKGEKKKAKEWSPMITVPQPFQMTTREEKKKQHRVKTKSEIEMENNLLKKYLEEEAECQKKFKANPVPASVFLPLYQEIVQRNEERRKFVKERRRELLLASQKPFQFIEREEQKKEVLRELLADLPAPKKKTRQFKARPVPKSIYSISNNDRIQEEQLYREIKIQMRAHELLQSSAEPKSLLASRSKQGTHKHKCLQNEDLRCKPKIHSQVPDFKALHQKFQQQLLKSKDAKPVTVCEPFYLHTLQIPSKKEKILQDIEEDEQVLVETRWPYQSPRCKPRIRCFGADSYHCSASQSKPLKTTESTKRRQQAIRKSIEEKTRQEEDQKRTQAQQKKRMEKLRKLITTRAKANDPHESIAQMSKYKIKKLRAHEKQRMREYFQELGQMESRIDNRPLLLERATQIHARMAAEKRFSHILKEAGLKEESLLKNERLEKSQHHFGVDESTSTPLRRESTYLMPPDSSTRESHEMFDLDGTYVMGPCSSTPCPRDHNGSQVKLAQRRGSSKEEKFPDNSVRNDSEYEEDYTSEETCSESDAD